MTLLLTGFLAACQSASPLGPGDGTLSEPESAVALPGFDAARACRRGGELRALQASAEDDWIDQTRRALRASLARTGASVTDLRVPTGDASREDSESASADVHLVGVLPGESADRILLVASYGRWALDGRTGRPTDGDASSVGLVLELARALDEQRRRFTFMILLLDDTSSGAAGRLGEGAATSGGFESSRRLARALDEQGLFPSVRFAAFFQHVAEDELVVVRDLFSHPIYRDVFVEAAFDLRHEDAFPLDAPFGSQHGSHRAFVERGMTRVVALSAATNLGPSSAHAGGESETCSPEGLEAVGSVTIEALDRIARRLARMDRFRESPLESPREASSDNASGSGPGVDPEGDAIEGAERP